MRRRRRRDDHHRGAQEGIPSLRRTSTRRRHCSSRRLHRTLADLKGKKLGAQAATTGEDYVKVQAGGRKATKWSRTRTSPPDQALTTGQVEAAISDLPVWTEAIRENPGGDVASRFDTGEQYGFGMKAATKP